MRYLLYDVFASEPLLGNPLAVYPDGRGLDATTMQRIAREMNLSETTFVLPAEAERTDVRLRIFTPATEMPMAGHPTIGSAFALAEIGAVRPGTPRIVIDLKVGPTPVELEWADSGLRFAWMTQQLPRFGPAVAHRAAVAGALGLDESALAPDLPVQEVSCGVPFLLVPLRERTDVDEASADAARLLALGGTLGSALPVFLFAVDPSAPAQVYSRMFAPGLGVLEDPATGSASGPLGCYLVEHGVVPPESAGSIVSQQGVKMGRASRIHIAIEGGPGAIRRVRIGGEAVLVGRGDLVGVNPGNA